MEAGISFAAACRRLASEDQAGSRPSASWGDYDRRQFLRQCRASGSEYPFGAGHTNARAVFARIHGLRKRPGMAAALAIASRTPQPAHDADDDRVAFRAYGRPRHGIPLPTLSETTYPRGPAVQVFIHSGCHPEIDNFSLQPNTASSIIPLIQQLLRQNGPQSQATIPCQFH